MHTIKISYNSIRPKGERLKTFGGTASGYEPLKEMFEKIDMVFKDQLDKTLAPMEEDNGRFHVRPIHILDICNLVGNNVVVGGVRRTAEIFLCDEDDWEVILAKYGINGIYDWDRHHEIGNKLYELNVLPYWWEDTEEDLQERTKLSHRRMSNNSIAYKSKPSRDMLNLIFTIMRGEGEPGFINMEEAQRRRPNAKGLNPCSEVLLDSKQVCNLTTINAMAFVKEVNGKNELDLSSMLHAQALSVRAGMRMTLIDLELDEWNDKHHRDRLIGASITGWKDAMEALGYTKEDEIVILQMLRNVAFEEKLRYANSLRIPMPLLDTTIKPEGTLSQVFGGVSNGLHVSHAPYYIRRIRINAYDPLAEVAMKLGWSVLPEVGTPGEDYKEMMENATTYVIEFPVKSPSKNTRAEQTLEEQFETYFMFQEYYTSHNSSNTITVKEDEWQKAEDIIFDRWDEFVGVSFISYDGGTYSLMPYKEIDEERYKEMISKMKPFDISILHEIEKEETEKDLDNMQECESGVCPII